ncbi:MAG: NAD-dependent epimerase/dehydratase family protein [Gaiellales bacterium]
MSTYLVTGGAGFIGSHVVELLRTRGHEAIVLDDLSKGVPTNVPADVPLHEVDIADREAVLACSAKLPPLAAVIHCAAQSSVVVSTTDPARDLLVNVAGTINVLDVCAQLRCPMAFTSTGGAIYGESAPRPTPETEATEPGAPYGASKASAEIYIRLWARQSGLPHAILRLGNVYGPRQRGDGEAGVVAIIAERLRDGAPITLYGHGTPTRDYVHVSDVARALVDAVGINGTFNIATGVETSVQEVYDLAVTAFSGEVTSEPTLADLRPGELSASCLDITRARTTLGWSPEIAVSEGIPATVRSLLS